MSYCFGNRASPTFRSSLFHIATRRLSRPLSFLYCHVAFRLTIDPLPMAGQLSETKPSTAYSADDLKQAASESVKKHLEQLDTDFLKALDFDIAQARKAEDNMVGEVCLYGKSGHPMLSEFSTFHSRFSHISVTRKKSRAELQEALKKPFQCEPNLLYRIGFATRIRFVAC